MLRQARISVSAIFFLHGVLVANWLSRIPAVQQKLGITVSALGIALLGSAAGALMAMGLITRIIARFGSGRVTRWTTFGLCAALALPAFAEGTAALTAFLAVYGAMAGAMDVSMNTQAVEVERGYQRPIIVGFHALFSLGGMVGAGMGGVAAGLGIAPEMHLPATGLFLSIPAWFAGRHLLEAEGKATEGGGERPRGVFRLVAGLAVVAFCILLGEGAVADWSAVYLSSMSGPAMAASGYAVFSLFMAAGRIAGDRLRARFGSAGVVRAGSGLAAVGLGGALLMGGMLPALIGFACMGAGWASIFPIVCGAAGHRTAGQPEAGVAAVTGTGFFAFLAGPPLIGFVAQATSLRAALGFVAFLSVVAVLLAGVVRNGEAGVGKSGQVWLP